MSAVFDDAVLTSKNGRAMSKLRRTWGKVPQALVFYAVSFDFPLSVSPVFFEFLDHFKTGMKFAIHIVSNTHTAFTADSDNPMDRKGKKL